MQVSFKPKKELRSRITRIAVAVGFALVIGSFGAGSAYAEHGHGGGHRGGGSYHARQRLSRKWLPEVYGRGYYGRGRYWGGGGGYWGGGGGYPNYYDAPSPYYYGEGPEYSYQPPQGARLFFGL